MKRIHNLGKSGPMKKEKPFRTEQAIPWVALFGFLVIFASVCLAGSPTYVYKCPKCGSIQSYDRPTPGVRCINDGWQMVPRP